MDIFDINGDALRKLREENGWTRDFLSEKSGVPVRTIQDIETGKSANPTIEVLKKMISAMPNARSDKKAQSTILAILKLTALDESQINTIIDVIDTLPAASALVNTSRAVGTDGIGKDIPRQQKKSNR